MTEVCCEFVQFLAARYSDGEPVSEGRDNRSQRIFVCCIESANGKGNASVCNVLLFIGQACRSQSSNAAMQKPESSRVLVRVHKRSRLHGVPIFVVG